MAHEFPNDIGVALVALLHYVRLAPREVVFVEPGTVHCYLGGLAVEVMASSDNVLRGGLTPKHVDVPELLRTLVFRAGPVERLRPQLVAGEGRYATPAEEFALAVLEVRPGARYVAPERRAVEILLCTEGRGQIAGREDLAVARGDCLLVPARAPRYAVEGDLVLYRATAGVAAR